MNFTNSKLTHFLSFVCVFESKVPRHAFLVATEKKKKKKNKQKKRISAPADG